MLYRFIKSFSLLSIVFFTLSCSGHREITNSDPAVSQASQPKAFLLSCVKRSMCLKMAEATCGKDSYVVQAEKTEKRNVDKANATVADLPFLLSGTKTSMTVECKTASQITQKGLKSFTIK